MSNGRKHQNRAEYYYDVGFIHKTLNIPQSYPCTSCHSWCSSLLAQLKDFQHKAELKKKVRNVFYIICTLQFVIYVPNEWTDGFKEK